MNEIELDTKQRLNLLDARVNASSIRKQLITSILS